MAKFGFDKVFYNEDHNTVSFDISEYIREHLKEVEEYIAEIEEQYVVEYLRSKGYSVVKDEVDESSLTSPLLAAKNCGDAEPHETHEFVNQIAPGVRGVEKYRCPGVAKFVEGPIDYIQCPNKEPHGLHLHEVDPENRVKKFATCPGRLSDGTSPLIGSVNWTCSNQEPHEEHFWIRKGRHARCKGRKKQYGHELPEGPVDIFYPCLKFYHKEQHPAHIHVMREETIAGRVLHNVYCPGGDDE